jgi:hypothetical protein
VAVVVVQLKLGELVVGHLSVAKVETARPQVSLVHLLTTVVAAEVAVTEVTQALLRTILEAVEVAALKVAQLLEL